MNNQSSVDHDIDCSAMKIHTAYHSHIELRIRPPNVPTQTVTYTYYSSYATQDQALRDARVQAEIIKAQPNDHLE
jgi:hypothetical protein